MLIKTDEEISILRESGKILNETLMLIKENIKAGVSTKKLDEIAYKYIVSKGGIPSTLNYEGYPASICASINREVVHGIPSSKRVLKEGDILSVDICVTYKGMITDAARTFAVGEISKEDEKLIRVTRECFFKAIENLKAGSTVGDIGYAVKTHAEKNGFSVVRALTGHGVGHQLHEDPAIPNYGTKGSGMRLRKNMVICVEPMINAGGFHVEFLADGWTCQTIDGKNSAHYENTIVILDDGVEILTR